jgi:hypothetical protein
MQGLQWQRLSKGKATSAAQSEGLSGPVQDLRWQRENHGL